MENIVEVLTKTFTGDIVDSICENSGENREKIGLFLRTIAPVLFGSIIKQLSVPDRTSALFKLFTSKDNNTNLIEDLSSVVNDKEALKTLLGSSIVEKAQELIIGDETKVAKLAKAFSKTFDVGTDNTNNILKLSIVGTASFIGGKIKAKSLGVMGFSELMSSQKQFVDRSAPIAKQLLGTIEDWDSESGVAAKEKSAVVNPSKSIITADVHTDNTSAGLFPMWLFPLLIFVGGGWLFARWYGEDRIDNNKQELSQELAGVAEQGAEAANKSGSKDNTKKNDKSSQTAEGETQLARMSDKLIQNSKNSKSAKDKNTGKTVNINNIAEPTEALKLLAREELSAVRAGNYKEITLPNTMKLTVANGGIAEKILHYLSSRQKGGAESNTKNAELNGATFTFTNLYFNIASPNVRGSTTDIYQVAKVLEAFPTAKVKIVGHADIDGSVKTNEDLSLARANKVKSILNLLGVDNNRIETQGAGAINPVTENTDAVSKLKNRRVEIVVSE